MSGTQVSNAITLTGSSEMVAEFFEFSVNSILYQRGVYPPEKFTRVQKYGMTVLVTDDKDLRTYLEGITKQLKELLVRKLIEKLVLVIANSELKTPIERWEFTIHSDPDVVDDSVKKTKSTDKIQAEIASIIRQIVACVTFLPQLGGSLAFDLLVYTKKDAKVNDSLWADSQPMLIEGGQTVKIKSFSTSIHSVDAAVVYL
ncbi:mitotic spindle assembly checkpoint protein MAD2A-like [Tropilaelaps mercedesae]|uniref:Mitotic spindle assembly checkpoint protein MAD2A-like n=1 Tax=Tropilaelaps mercedesae TaxID=418985 RepID=A0A1V9XU49_9ACAR|nr:mitotic spindle assembly checkpoint protein MAD2A-like [Tropilaelaps mercedesae]